MRLSIVTFMFLIISLGLLSDDLYAINFYRNPSHIIRTVAQTDSLTLPVELIYFYALVESESVLLKWGTATEVNNYGFEIERSNNSVDNWKVIDFVLGNGTSNVPIDYEYLDTTVIKTDTCYYRLKQIDVVGGFHYSDTVSINFPSSIRLEKFNLPVAFEVSINFPNPFNPSTKIIFQIPFQQVLKINLYDIDGKLVKEIASQEFLPGSYELFLDFSNYSSGIYFVRFESLKSVVTKRLAFIK